jgi:predicted nucleotidyltransferase
MSEDGEALVGSLRYDASELKRLLEGHGVILAYLYGSQARGVAGPLSDVDVAVLFQPQLAAKERWHRRLTLTAGLTSVFHRSDVFVADLAEATPLLKNEVRREGQVLYCADEDVRVEFEVQALREFEDTKLLRRIQQLYLLERIERGELGHYPQLLEE